MQTLRTAHTDRTMYTPESLPLDTGRQRLVVLGTGWAAARLLRDIDPHYYDITVSIAARKRPCQMSVVHCWLGTHAATEHDLEKSLPHGLWFLSGCLSP